MRLGPPAVAPWSTPSYYCTIGTFVNRPRRNALLAFVMSTSLEVAPLSLGDLAVCRSHDGAVASSVFSVFSVVRAVRLAVPPPSAVAVSASIRVHLRLLPP